VARAGADVADIVEGARRQLDRARLANLLLKMKEEGFGSSLTVFNSLMRFHSAYGENRVREVTVLYSQVPTLGRHTCVPCVPCGAARVVSCPVVGPSP
jgi:hypothetical protein